MTIEEFRQILNSIDTEWFSEGSINYAYERAQRTMSPPMKDPFTTIMSLVEVIANLEKDFILTVSGAKARNAKNPGYYFSDEFLDTIRRRIPVDILPDPSMSMLENYKNVKYSLPPIGHSLIISAKKKLRGNEIL